MFNNIAVAGEEEKFNDTLKRFVEYDMYFRGKYPDIVGPHDLIANPQFSDVAGNDSASPEVDTAFAGFGVKQDNLGNIRPSGKESDRGTPELEQR